MENPEFTAASNYLQMEEIATALGDMVIAWSRGELALINAMAAILSSEEYEASRIYSQLPNFHSRVKVLRVMIEAKPSFTPLRRPIDKLSNLSSIRNSLVHGFYLTGNDQTIVVNHSAPDTSDDRWKPCTANDIHQHAQTVRLASKALNERIEELVDKSVREGLDLGEPDLRPHRKPRQSPQGPAR